MVPVSRFVFLFLPCVLVFLSCYTSAPPRNGDARESLRLILGDENLGKWLNGVPEAAAPAPGPSGDGFGYTFVLAGNRTICPDILKGFKKYHGGWDITDRHYWATLQKVQVTFQEEQNVCNALKKSYAADDCRTSCKWCMPEGSLFDYLNV